MSVLAQRSLTQVVTANSFELAGQHVVSKLPVQKHLAAYLKQHGGWRPKEAKGVLDDIFDQVGKHFWTIGLSD